MTRVCRNINKPFRTGGNMMYRSGNKLSTPADFDNAVLFQLNVEVWQEKEPIDRGGFIKNHSDIWVKFEDGYFLKDNCVFQIR
jgi:hypothetical protein